MSTAAAAALFGAKSWPVALGPHAFGAVGYYGSRLCACIRGALTLIGMATSIWGRNISTDGPDVDRRQAFQRSVDHALPQQEAKRMRLVSVDEAEVSQYPGE